MLIRDLDPYHRYYIFLSLTRALPVYLFLPSTLYPYLSFSLPHSTRISHYPSRNLPVLTLAGPPTRSLDEKEQFWEESPQSIRTNSSQNQSKVLEFAPPAKGSLVEDDTSRNSLLLDGIGDSFFSSHNIFGLNEGKARDPAPKQLEPVPERAKAVGGDARPGEDAKFGGRLATQVQIDQERYRVVHAPVEAPSARNADVNKKLSFSRQLSDLLSAEEVLLSDSDSPEAPSGRQRAGRTPAKQPAEDDPTGGASFGSSLRKKLGILEHIRHENRQKLQPPGAALSKPEKQQQQGAALSK